MKNCGTLDFKLVQFWLMSENDISVISVVEIVGLFREFKAGGGQFIGFTDGKCGTAYAREKKGAICAVDLVLSKKALSETVRRWLFTIESHFDQTAFSNITFILRARKQFTRLLT